jgi:hypothetical protein
MRKSWSPWAMRTAIQGLSALYLLVSASAAIVAVDFGAAQAAASGPPWGASEF